MKHPSLRFFMTLFLLFIGLTIPSQFVSGQDSSELQACADLAFSTEEDFVTQGPLPPDGNPIISDGDLLGPNHAVCARNQTLLAAWGLLPDLGLDAVDLIALDSQRPTVVFSTELNDPEKRFTNGDLLVTNGTTIPNVALLLKFDLQMDLGLDALHLQGKPEAISTFLSKIQQISREQWLAQPSLLADLLAEYNIDIWFSTEGTAPPDAPVPFLDGDVLSARTGTIVMSQDQLLSLPIPAGIPNRGVDFGLDGVTSTRDEEPDNVLFSTEILFREELSFTDGDILKLGGGIVIPHNDLITPFEPAANFLSIDAFYLKDKPVDAPERFKTFLPLITKRTN